MTKNRVIPFGYCMKNGEITVEITECKAVVRIFEEWSLVVIFADM